MVSSPLGGAPTSGSGRAAPPSPHSGARLLALPAPDFGYTEGVYSLPGFDPMAGYFNPANTPGSGYQIPTLSAAAGGALGIYYVDNSSRLVELELANESLRVVAPVVPLYDRFGPGTTLNGMIDDEFFIDSGYDQALFFGTLTSGGSTYSLETVNLTTGARLMWNTSFPIDGTNQQANYVGNNTVLVISSNCSIFGFNLAASTVWRVGTVGANFGPGGQCLSANNAYWLPQKQEMINVEASGSTGDHVEQLDASYSASGQIDLSSVATISAASGDVFNWVNGLAYNATADRIAFSAGYWVNGVANTFVLGYSGGLLTTAGERTYSADNSGVVTGRLLEIQRYVYTGDYMVGQSQGPTYWTNSTQYIFDPWNGSTLLANHTVNRIHYGNQAFEAQYPGSPDELLDFNATLELNDPMYRVVFAYHGPFTPYPAVPLGLTPDAGPPGTVMTVAASGLVPLTRYDLCWTTTFSATGCPSTNGFTSTAGGTVPPSTLIVWSGGSSFLALARGSYAANFTSSASFRPTSLALGLEPSAGPARSLVAVLGGGLAPSTGYDYCWSDSASPVDCGAALSFTTGPNGTVPANVSSTNANDSGWLSISQAGSASSFITSIPFTPTVPSLTLSPPTGPNGTEPVWAVGSGFAQGVNYSICWASSASPVGCSGSEIVRSDAAGAINGTPGSAFASARPWLAVSQGPDPANFITSTQFGVTVPTLLLSPSSGPIGAEVRVAGSGLAPSTAYHLCLTADGLSICPSKSINFTTDPAGDIGTVPELKIASASSTVATISGVGNRSIASIGFRVTVPSIRLPVGQGPSNALGHVNGSGFASGGWVNLTVGASQSVGPVLCSIGSVVGRSIVAAPSGAFDCSFRVPPGLSAGSHPLLATDGASGATADGSFEVTEPALALSEVTVTPGSSVTVLGTGFDVDANLTVTLGSLTVSSIDSCTQGSESGSRIVSSSSGGFSCTLTIPSSAPSGSWPLTVTSEVSGAAATGNVTVVPPAAPLPSSSLLLIVVAVVVVAAVAALGLLLSRRRRGGRAPPEESFGTDEPTEPLESDEPPAESSEDPTD